MNEFEEIKEAIYNMYINVFNCEYNKTIEITKENNMYKIVLPQNNDVMPINLFIEADNDKDCINKDLNDLLKRDLWRTSFNILKRVRISDGQH